MSETKEIKIPDIGGVENVDVVEVLVKAGDQVAVEDPLVTLESDKATMDIPSTEAGTVKEVKVNSGDKVSEGDVILSLEAEGQAETEATEKQTSTDSKEESTESEPESSEDSKQAQEIDSSSKSEASQTKEIKVPDIGTDEAVDIVEVAITPGDQVEVDAPLMTLESDKATMDVPSPLAGEITEVKVKAGDQVKQGDLIALAKIAASEESETSTQENKETGEADKKQEKAQPEVSKETETKANSNKPQEIATPADVKVHAGPAVRRLANELGVNLSKVNGTGRKGRIVAEDVHQYVKQVMQQQGGGSGVAVPEAPQIDFSKFGEIETQPLSKIKKLTGSNMRRNWLTVPHVTQHEEVDITEMEAFRQAHKKEAEKVGGKLTPIVFVMKAVVAALKAYPHFNASLDPSGEKLIMKKYFHIGVAVDTPNGLVVPVIRDVDQKSLFDLSVDLIEMSKKARDGKLLPTDMQGGCFTISSLGGIGGTAFTPIVNSPEVAILGLSRSDIKPRYDGNEFKPRLILPLSLSYDHRVIDGANGARFVTHLANSLSDLRCLLL